MLHFYRKLYEPKELDVLSDSQRRYVHRECIHPMTIRLPLVFAKSVLLAGYSPAGHAIRGV